MNAKGCLTKIEVRGYALWVLVGNRGDGVARGVKGIACMGGFAEVIVLNCCESWLRQGKFGYPLYAINFTAV